MLESWHVVLRYCTQLLLVGGAVTYSTLAPALGLGDITVHSALNQPFSADIALVDAAGLAESDLSVSLATADEFGRAGVERVFFLNNLKFSPILRGNRTLIRVTSSKPVNEPFLNFLVQLNQPNGRLLREYTVLIDPPGSPGIVPATDEPSAKEPTSGFPSVEPTPAPKALSKSKAPAPTASAPPPVAPANDEVAEQLAASVLQNQQLQKTIDELNARIKTQDEQIADERKQVSDLQTRLSEVAQKPAAAPVAAVAPTPVVVEEPESSNWLLIAGVLALVLLVVLGLFVRRQRQQALTEPLSTAPLHDEPEREIPPEAARAAAPLPDHREETPAGDVLEGVGIYMAYGRFSEAAGLLREALAKEPQRTDLALHLLEVLGKQGDAPAYDTQENSLLDAGVDPQQLADLRARFPKLASVAPAAPIVPVIATVAAVAPEALSGDDFQLNLDDLSMDSNWDLVSPFEDSPSPKAKPSVPDEPAFTSNLHVMPDVYEMPDEPALGEPELEWDAEPEAQSLDDDFLDAFNEPGQLLELEPLPEPVPTGAGKLEQAQTCIDDGDLDSAIELLNELLKEGDEPLKQTARTLLAGIR
ncbi:FimV/HubP family polar landmark protein [Pseudomonas nunensis]|uniref:Peptidoglycan-binding protein LysM n=1 Tax=Pseudomonas nunensis TaxID=2961896 RepID=A0ABY5EA82_9PSED|nr:FimV/HubP family polar landmark protein [Pseudomonas nunensis]KPN92150.1 peptidoglycan-binding protein LysM [Pseudomonas nunensis]MCL5226930.1 peptidoglycan-binding protein LysM [Pseudomonas nunensis]UTO12369.1 peptidoglycan-binding protein LysM [Pseudomonas nunensis]